MYQDSSQSPIFHQNRTHQVDDCDCMSVLVNGREMKKRVWRYRSRGCLPCLIFLSLWCGINFLAVPWSWDFYSVMKKIIPNPYYPVCVRNNIYLWELQSLEVEVSGLISYSKIYTFYHYYYIRRWRYVLF